MNSMNGGREQSLFFLSLPDLRRLCLVPVSLLGSTDDARSRQIKTCRELVLLYPDILGAPALNSFTDITLVMAIPFYKKGIIQAYGHRNNLQLGAPQCVLPGILQCCVSYSLTTRLAPCWNKAGPHLLSGKDFLTESGRLNAVSVEMNARANQLCISVEANTVRLPPNKLEDFDFPPMVLKNFSSHQDAVLYTSCMGVSYWCYVLPSMKRGQIISISHQLPKEDPFKTYQDLQNHWQSLYGYSLPELTAVEELYCSVYFKPVGERLFTYPLSCIRLQPIQCYPRVNLQGALNSFLSDLRDRLQSICGLPVRMNSKPCYHTNSLTITGSAKVLDGKPVNLTTKSSVRPVITQLPAPAVKPLFGPQLPARPQNLSHQAGGQSCGERQENEHPAVDPAPKLVPIFRNKSLSRHVNVTQLLAQKHQQQRRGGGAGERGRVTLPACIKKRAAPAPSSSCAPSDPCMPSSSSTLLSSSVPSSLFFFSSSQGPKAPQVPPPRSLPGFAHRPKPSGVSALRPSHDRPNHIPAPSPDNTSRPTPSLNLSASQRVDFRSVCDIPPRQDQPPSSILKPPTPTVLFDVPSTNGGEMFESKPKRARCVIRDVDVETLARNNQLSKVNSATLLAWLRGRGVAVRSKDKKEELMLRVMSCLAEA